MSQKGKRNRVYKFCGWFMLACLLGCVLYIAFKDTIVGVIGDFPVIFTLETAALFAFAASWLTKGETLLPDGEHYLVSGWKRLRDFMPG